MQKTHDIPNDIKTWFIELNDFTLSFTLKQKNRYFML